MVLFSAYMSRGERYLIHSTFISFTKGLYSHKCLITFSFVPTPSVPQARRGSVKPAAFKSKRPAKPPRSTSQPVGRENLFLAAFQQQRIDQKSRYWRGRHIFLSLRSWIRNAFPTIRDKKAEDLWIWLKKDKTYSNLALVWNIFLTTKPQINIQCLSWLMN